MPTQTVEGLASLETSVRGNEQPMPIITAQFLSANNSHSDHERSSSSELDAEDFINASKPYPRWWTPIGIGEFKIRALIDNGASRTCFCPVGLQLVTALGAKVKTYSGPTVRNASEYIIPIGAQVRLPIKVANTKKYIVAYVAHEFDYDCVLGANWNRKFNAMIYPEKHILLLDRQETIPLEFDVRGRNESTCLAPLGPTVADKAERQEIESLLDEFAPVVQGPSIACTHLVEHTIEVTSNKPVKQKYYPLSQKL